MSRMNSQTCYWGKYDIPQGSRVFLLTEFELKCQQLNLDTFQKQFESNELRNWVISHMTQYYVPEKLLKAWDLSVYIDVG